MTDPTTPDAPDRLVALSVLALELETTADELAGRLAGDLVIADELGRRAVPATTARSMIEAEAQRRYNNAEAARKQQAALEQNIRELNARRPVPRGVKINAPDGMLPVQALVAADGKPKYDGGVYRPVPGAVDWAFGGAEGGELIGPTPKQVAAAAAERAAARQRNKARRTS